MVMRIRHRRHPGILWPEFKDKAVIGFWLLRVDLSNSHYMINPSMTGHVAFQGIAVF